METPTATTIEWNDWQHNVWRGERSDGLAFTMVLAMDGTFTIGVPGSDWRAWASERFPSLDAASRACAAYRMPDPANPAADVRERNPS